MNTAEILKMLKATDDSIVDKAFSFLYREYFPVINYYVKENNGSEEAAADIFQDAIIVLYSKVREQGFELNCTLKTFLYSISRNLWLKALAAKKKEVLKKEAFKTIPLDPTIADVLEEDEKSLLVAQLLRKLGGDYERLLTYFYFDGLKTDEVTIKMGYANEQVTRNKKSKCLKKLRQLLQESNSLKDQLF